MACSEERWQCISQCGSCCRLNPEDRQDSLEALSESQRDLYLSMVGPDGWCIHFNTGARSCNIYESRPDFCRVSNLVSLFGGTPNGDPADHNSFAIACCKQQIRSEYGGRGKVMRRFSRAIRRLP